MSHVRTRVGGAGCVEAIEARRPARHTPKEGEMMSLADGAAARRLVSPGLEDRSA